MGTGGYSQLEIGNPPEVATVNSGDAIAAASQYVVRAIWKSERATLPRLNALEQLGDSFANELRPKAAPVWLASRIAMTQVHHGEPKVNH